MRAVAGGVERIGGKFQTNVPTSLFGDRFPAPWHSSFTTPSTCLRWGPSAAPPAIASKPGPLATHGFRSAHPARE